MLLRTPGMTLVGGMVTDGIGGFNFEEITADALVQEPHTVWTRAETLRACSSLCRRSGRQNIRPYRSVLVPLPGR